MVAVVFYFFSGQEEEEDDGRARRWPIVSGQGVHGQSVSWAPRREDTDGGLHKLTEAK